MLTAVRDGTRSPRPRSCGRDSATGGNVRRLHHLVRGRACGANPRVKEPPTMRRDGMADGADEKGQLTWLQ
jgi:hypothetical protein